MANTKHNPKVKISNLKPNLIRVIKTVEQLTMPTSVSDVRKRGVITSKMGGHTLQTLILYNLI